MKRFLDFILSLIAIIILSPVFLIVSIIQLLTLKENIIFSQYRPGRNGKVFKLYKFKSMRAAYDKHGNLLEDKDRITKFGKFLRKTSIDELPQLFNILKGDMSFVGPRPRLVKDAVFYTKETLETYSVRPGLTSPIQIAGGRSEASWEEIFASDLEYVKTISFWKDVSIIFKTALYLFSCKLEGNFTGKSKREYYYSDYLLKTKKITRKEYHEGLATADQIIEANGVVHAFTPNLNMALALNDNENSSIVKKKKTSAKKSKGNTKTTKTSSATKPSTTKKQKSQKK